MGTRIPWEFGPFDKLVHDRSQFDCGVNELNDYLKTKISPDLKRNIGRAIVACSKNTNRILGFYTLSMGQVTWESLPDSYSKRIPKYPVPVARIGRLAVDISVRGQGLGGDLLMHAHMNVLRASEQVAAFAVIVDAKNETAENFYRKYGYEYLSTSSSSKTLFLPLKTISDSFE